MSRALVTGCAGFIGSHLTEALLTAGVAVRGVDCFNGNYGRPAKMRNLERGREWDAFEFVPLDLARGDVDDLVEDVDVVFHLAAEPGVRPSWGHRFETYLRNNLLATQHLLEACKRQPERRFVYASSSSIYGQAERLPTPESCEPRPFSPYGVTKLGAEHLCAAFGANHGLDSVILRYFSVYGPRQRPDMAFYRLCEAVLEGQPITVYGDGGQTRDFTFVEDVVSATIAAATAPVDAGTYNVGGGSRVSLNRVIELLGEVAGSPVEVIHAAPQHGDVRDTGADTDRARRDLGWAATRDLREGLEQQLAWALEERRRSVAGFA